MPHDDIRIGTLVQAENRPAETIRQILPHGFESFQLTFPGRIDGLDLDRIAEDVRRVLEAQGNAAIISAVGIYGNPLVDEHTAQGFAALIDAAPRFGTRLVCGFTGRIVNRPVPDSLPAFKQVFSP